VAALQLCFAGVFDIAFAGSNKLLISQNGVLDAVSLTDGSVTSLLPAYDGDLREVAGGFAGDAYFTSGCLVKRISAVDGTGTITTVGGNGGCDPGGRLNDQPATLGTLNPTRLTSYPGGLLVAEVDDIRLIDRTSLTSHPPHYTQNGDASLGYATLSGGHTSCSFGGDLASAFSFPDCNNPYVQAGLLDDNYFFTVAEDEGNVDPTPAGWGWVVDTMAPTAPGPSAPSDTAHVDSATPLFQWSASSDPGRTSAFGSIAGSGVDHYELVIDGVKDSDAACCETHAAHPLAEGTRHWQVRAVDRAGNASSAVDRTLEYGSPPTAVINAAPNPALAGTTVTADGTASGDAEGAIADYAWDLDGDGSYERDTGAAASTTVSFGQPGSYTLGLRVTDGAGKTSTATTQLRVNAGTVAGSLFGVTINNGAQYTRDPNVIVGVKAPSTVSGVIVSNDGGFLAPSSFPVAKEIKWRLDSSGPERLPKIVYARFRAGAIVLDNTFTDDIILDETPPVVRQASLAPAGTAAASAATRKRGFVVKVKATDSNSGVVKVQVAAVKRKPGKFVAYRRTLRVKLAARPKFIRARDRAGNLSRWKKIR
jgi:hypothetical protein